MKSTFKIFLHRGLLFGGFGPIVVGIVAAIHQLVDGSPIATDGLQICLAIVSSYLLAFVQAGATVFNQIESWSLPRSMLFSKICSRSQNARVAFSRSTKFKAVCTLE